MAKVTINVNLPRGVNESDLKEYLNFLLLGHSCSQLICEKFNHDLDVEDFEIVK